MVIGQARGITCLGCWREGQGCPPPVDLQSNWQDKRCGAQEEKRKIFFSFLPGQVKSKKPKNKKQTCAASGTQDVRPRKEYATHNLRVCNLQAECSCKAF